MHRVSFRARRVRCIDLIWTAELIWTTLVRIKSLVFALVKAFEITPAVPEDDILGKETIVVRPTLKSEKDRGTQMPLMLRRIL